MTSLMWFRRDLRLSDNPAWTAATSETDEVVALFVIDPTLWKAASQPRRSLLAANLTSLDDALRELGGRLRVERGTPESVIADVAHRSGAERVHWNADYTPYAAARDRAVAETVDADVSHGGVIHRPGTVLTKAGGRYRVFTPFHRTWQDTPIEPVGAPSDATIASDDGVGVPDEGAPPIEPGEVGAAHRLELFLDHVDRYPDERDRPDLDTTSRLSVDLKFGTIGPRTVMETVGSGSEGRRAFIRQLAWRDFYADILEDAPETADVALRPDYRSIEWDDDPDDIAAWKTGTTGYPIVDAGMRQLLGEGWMHNRVRMIVASFLVKDLLVDWRIGERFFRHHLLDVDVASNVGNWQWAAGTGADAAPYFRIFNPVSQSEKFDPDGTYIRRWVPELAELDRHQIHAPWTVGPLELAAAGVVLGDSYPEPIVDHRAARERTLERYKAAVG